MSNQVVTALNIGESTLKALLQLTGQFLPVPGIAVAAHIALSILQEVQTMKTRKEGFIIIGRVLCFIVETIIRSVQVGQSTRMPNDPGMLQHIDLLVVDLQYIEKQVKKAKGRSRARKIFRHWLDQVMVRRCQERLANTMILFGFQYDTEIHKQLASVHNLLSALFEALSCSSTFSAHPEQIQRPSISSIQCGSSSIFSTLPPRPTPRASLHESQGSQERAEQGVLQDLGQPRIASEIIQERVNMAPSNPIRSPAEIEFNSVQGTQNHLSSGAVIVDVNDTRGEN